MPIYAGIPRLLTLACLLATGATLAAQQLLVDRGVQAAGLWCFPAYGDSLAYYYLPARGRLGLTEDGVPEFSFIRYVTEDPGPAGAATVTEAGGGGILNFLVLYDTPADQVERSTGKLRELLKNDEIVLKGPVAFTSGRYLLVSSILLPDGQEKREVLATGTAPVLENSRVAFSFDLDPQRSKLLMESFKMNTPDISVVFELQFGGLTENYEAEITVDWDELRKHQSYQAGGSVYFVSAEVEAAFDEMRRDNTIRMRTVGSDAHLDGLVTTVYDKLLTLLFDKVEPEQLPGGGGGLMDAIGSLIGAGGALSSSNTTGFGLSAGYRYKELKSTGSSKLHFDGQSSVTRNHFVTFNIGDLWRRYGDREDMFRTVALYDPAYRQREIQVNLDGTLQQEFAAMVNSVTVRLRKEHGSGRTTMGEVKVTRENYRDSTGQFRMLYLTDGDSSMTDWLTYSYQTVWQFAGAGSYTTEWDTTDAAMINLYAPFHRRQILLEGDLDQLAETGVRAVSVQISYPFFDEDRSETRLLRPGDDPSVAGFEVTLPRGHDRVEYRVAHMKPGDSPLRWTGTDEFGLIFFDENPQGSHQ